MNTEGLDVRDVVVRCAEDGVCPSNRDDRRVTVTLLRKDDMAGYWILDGELNPVR